MIDFNFCKNCYGCGVCSNVCPENAIEMKQDENGFIMPMIDKIKCISCGLCDKMCPALASKEAGGNGKDVFLYVNPDADRWICDFYDTTGGRQHGDSSGIGGSNASAGMVHIK